MPGRKIDPNENIYEVPHSVTTAICESLDKNGKWRTLIEHANKDERFKLRLVAVERQLPGQLIQLIWFVSQVRCRNSQESTNTIIK